MMETFIQSDDMDNLKKYIQDISHKTKELVQVYDTGIPVLDYLLDSLHKDFVKYDIRIQLNVDHVNTSSMSIVDLNVILSNLLENALECCILEENHSIRIYFHQDMNYIVIRIENECHKIYTLDGEYVTRKENKEAHGIGITSVKNVVVQHNGNCSFEYDEDKQIFKAIVILPMDTEMFL